MKKKCARSRARRSRIARCDLRGCRDAPRTLRRGEAADGVPALATARGARHGRTRLTRGEGDGDFRRRRGARARRADRDDFGGADPRRVGVDVVRLAVGPRGGASSSPPARRLGCLEGAVDARLRDALHRRRGRGRDARVTAQRATRSGEGEKRPFAGRPSERGFARGGRETRTRADRRAGRGRAGRGGGTRRRGPERGKRPTAEAQTPDEAAETTKPASDVGVTASQKRAPPDKRDSPWRRFVKRTWARRRLSPKLCVCCEPPSWLWQTTPIPMGRPRCFPPGSFGSPRPYRDTSTRSSGCAARTRTRICK